jgi:hypothetical protein
MADYKELLRRAIEILPENNGAARRAVYEKARSALVGQLRAINPPLPARDITQHRLQLEDCIRDVEREASEANIAGLKANIETPPPVMAPPPPPAAVQTPINDGPWIDSSSPAPAAASPVAAAPVVVTPVVSAPTAAVFTQVPRAETAVIKPSPVQAVPTFAVVKPEAEPEPEVDVPPAAEEPKVYEFAPAEPSGGSIEDIIAEAERTSADEPVDDVQDEPVAEAEPDPAPEPEAPVETKPEMPALFRLEPRPMPTIVAPAKPPVPANSGFGEAKPFEPVRRGPTFDVRREAISTSQLAEPVISPVVTPSIRSQTVALQQVAEPIAVLDQLNSATPAMSAVREVEVEPAADVAAKEAQVTIERAIATLDREARGETTPLEFNTDAPVASPPPLLGLKRDQARAQGDPSFVPEQSFPRAAADNERGGFNAITIFLVVFVLLLVGAGGAGFWAWREGYIDPQAMFGSSAPAVADAQTPAEAASPAIVAPTADTATGTGPGNTAAPEAVAPAPELKTDERLTGTPVAPTAALPAPADQAAPNGEIKTEERLPVVPVPSTDAQIAATEAPSLDATAAAGSQSLLLEASDDGTTGAVPFSGTVDWSQGKDEVGQPTLVGKASIPARNLSVDVLIRKNSDPSLPASHLMEINFSVTDSFIGGSIAGLPGVLLKNEELVQGTPLVGASARVVGNSFLFALSASAEDATANSGLLTTRKWMDLAIVYATGKRAIITLEKDAAAEKLFADVFKAWADAPTASTTP